MVASSCGEQGFDHHARHGIPPARCIAKPAYSVIRPCDAASRMPEECNHPDHDEAARDPVFEAFEIVDQIGDAACP
jgi:hypothetical protein